MFYLLENLALNKQTGQSSTSSSGGSGRAVDGNSDPDFNNGHCSHTNDNNPSWWRVDLGSDRVPVAEVHIVNRLVTVHPDRNEDYKITVGEYFFFFNPPFLSKPLTIYFLCGAPSNLLCLFFCKS